MIDPTTNWTFTLKGTGVNETDSTAADGTVDFNGANLLPGATYTICEYGMPAGWSSTWLLDGNPVVPFNPDAPLENLGTLCYAFTATAGHISTFRIDNREPGGGTRTIGYWKNWNRCTGGNQAQTAAKNGGGGAGFYLVEDLLPKLIGDYNVNTCQKAVNLLGKRDAERQEQGFGRRLQPRRSAPGREAQRGRRRERLHKRDRRDQQGADPARLHQLHRLG